jgi:hypothetical protein
MGRFNCLREIERPLGALHIGSPKSRSVDRYVGRQMYERLALRKVCGGWNSVRPRQIAWQDPGTLPRQSLRARPVGMPRKNRNLDAACKEFRAEMRTDETCSTGDDEMLMPRSSYVHGLFIP